MSDDNPHEFNDKQYRVMQYTTIEAYFKHKFSGLDSLARAKKRIEKIIEEANLKPRPKSALNKRFIIPPSEESDS